VSEPARDLPVGSPAVEQAVELARRGVITHLTVRGERVAAEALRAAEDADDAAEADVAMDEPGESIPWEQVKAELELRNYRLALSSQMNDCSTLPWNSLRHQDDEGSEVDAGGDSFRR
jgi:hypothetical protein